jgi:hypothetical protein
MELIKMSNQEVAKRMYEYIIRINNLMKEVSKILNHTSKTTDENYIREEYKALKFAIREDAHYMSLSRNDKDDDSVLQNQFKWVINEAAAWGFTAPTNSRIDFSFYSSLSEAEYKLTKHTSLEGWKELSEKK